MSDSEHSAQKNISAHAGWGNWAI